MQKIIDSLHQKFSNMQYLRAREIRVDKQQRKVFCALSYPNLNELDKQIQHDITTHVKSLVPTGYSAIVSFSNDHFTENSFKRFLTDLLKKKYPVFASISKHMAVSISDKCINIVFHINTTMQTNIEAAQLTAKLKNYLLEYTFYTVNIEVVVDLEDTNSIELSEQKKLVQLAVNRELLKPSRYFSVTNVVKHIGKAIAGSPMYIADLRKQYDSCVICGVVSGKSLKASKKDANMYVCKFTLTDASGAGISCIIFTRFEITDVNAIKENMGKTESEAQTMSKTRAFANERKMKKMMDIYDGMEIVVRGRIAVNSFSEQLEMTVHDLSKCKIEPIGNMHEFNKPVANDYLLVRPEQFQEYMQTSFVNKIIGKSLLSGRKIVVLHVNSTGFNAVKDKIFAICCVKLLDGHIAERLFTYINPEVDVNESMLSKAKISIDKIVFYPTITELISDIYKFTYDCDLVGMNLSQILELINYYASPVGYKFTNVCIAQNDMFSDLFDKSYYTKKPNCSKLEDVARQCRVPFIESRFCEETALVAAQSMIALANKLK